MTKEWKTLKSKIGYDHPFFRVREDSVLLPNGINIPDYTVWESGNVSQVIPITPDGKYLLVRQYKHGLGDEILEFPGGFVDDDEDPHDAALRELSEETGYTSKEIIKLGIFSHHPTKETGKLHLFLAKNIEKQVKKLKADQTENISLVFMSEHEILNLISSGAVLQTGSILGFLLALQREK